MFWHDGFELVAHFQFIIKLPVSDYVLLRILNQGIHQKSDFKAIVIQLNNAAEPCD